MDSDMKAKPSLRIKWIAACHIEQVAKVDKASFEASWSEERIEKFCLQEQDHYCLVAESELGVVGYLVWAMDKGTIYLQRLAVSPDHRLQGVAKSLVERMTRKGNRRVVANVCDSDLGSQLFFSKVGFKATRVVHGAFGDQDGYRFELSRNEPDGAAVLKSIMEGDGKVVR